ncbi:MAG: sugar transferase [Planctomycetota bacterium]|nr:sugar transferase [Planctomycetota bacterium]
MSWFRRNFDQVFLALHVLVDGLAIVSACVLAFWLTERGAENSSLELAGMVKRHLVPGIVGLATTLFFLWYLHLYQWQKSILNVQEYKKVFQVVVISFLCTATYLFLFRNFGRTIEEHFPSVIGTSLHGFLEIFSVESETAGNWRKGVFLSMFGFIFLFLCVERMCMFRCISWLHEKGFGNIPVAIIGTGPMANRLQQKMRLFPFLGFRFLGFLDPADEPDQEAIHGHPLLGSLTDLETVCATHSVQQIFIADPEMPEDRLLGLCARLDAQGVRYSVVPRLYHFFSQSFRLDTLDTIPLLQPSRYSNKYPVDFLKRLFDLVIAAILLVISLPIFFFVAIALKLKSPGPILFSQTRVGQKGHTFSMLKFRSMHIQQCGDERTPSETSDSRIVPGIGGFLRRYSLDELPQLWNVLRGEMSLVGPRPEMPFIVAGYGPLEMNRLAVKPGLTGLWQVSEARKAPIHDNMDYDLYYIEHQSLFLDLLILGMTAIAVFRIRGTA